MLCISGSDSGSNPLYCDSHQVMGRATHVFLNRLYYEDSKLREEEELEELSAYIFTECLTIQATTQKRAKVECLV